MGQSTAITPEQRDEFTRRGVLRIEGLLSEAGVRRARETVLRRLEQLGLWRDGAWRLGEWPKPQWPSSGVKTSKVIGNRHPALEALSQEPRLRAIVDELLGGRAFDRKIHPRPQLLFTLPNIDAWVLPPHWHTDAPRLASGEPPGVQLFACLDHVAPRAGATLAIAGSHLLLNGRRHMRAKDLHRELGGEPFFRRIWSKRPLRWDDAEDLPRGAVHNISLEVVELTGAPGDGYLLDLRTLHSGAPNAGDQPRMMVTDR